MRILSLNYMNASLATMVRSLELARATAARGHQVTLVFVHERFRPPESFRRHLESLQAPGLELRFGSRQEGSGVPGTVTAARPSALGLARQAAASLRHLPREIALIGELRPDVVVARPDHVLSFPISCGLTGTPLVLDTDGPVEELDLYWGIRSLWFRRLDLIRARAAGALLHVSRVCGDLWRAKAMPEDRLHLCPNGADPDFFRPQPEDARRAVRRSLGLDGRRVIAFSGNQRTWHGVGDLLAAAMPLLARDPDLRILVIGQMEVPAALRLAEIGETLVRERVVFTGPVAYPEMPRWLDAADVAALPYPALDLFHFSPMKMFEALAMAKVLVAPSQGQIAEILEPLPSAVLYDPRRAGALTDALAKALCLPDGAGIAGRRLIESGHSWARRAEVVEAACVGAMTRARAAGRARATARAGSRHARTGPRP
jgi:glycosyltransferase involved in cell wall biosynthesis